MRNRWRTRNIVIGVSLASIASVLLADQLTGQEAVDARQHNLKDLGGAFKAVRDQTRKAQPDLMQVQQAAEQIQQLAEDMDRWFPKGSEPGEDVETDAKAEIWSDPKGFAAAQAKFQQEAPKLLTLAKAKNVDGLKKQVGVVGGTCKGCHDKYRVPEEE